MPDVPPGDLPDPAEHPIVLYDGTCGLCDRSVRFIVERDPAGRFRYVTLQSGLGRRLLAGHGLAGGYENSVVLLDAEGAWTHSTAVLRISRSLRGPARLLRGFLWVPRPLRDAAYNVVARHRKQWFGEADACRRRRSRPGSSVDP